MPRTIECVAHNLRILRKFLFARNGRFCCGNCAAPPSPTLERHWHRIGRVKQPENRKGSRNLGNSGLGVIPGNSKKWDVERPCCQRPYFLALRTFIDGTVPSMMALRRPATTLIVGHFCKLNYLNCWQPLQLGVMYVEGFRGRRQPVDSRLHLRENPLASRARMSPCQAFRTFFLN